MAGYLAKQREFASVEQMEQLMDNAWAWMMVAMLEKSKADQKAKTLADWMDFVRGL